MPIFKAAFVETNPAPIKYAMQKLGLAGGPLRLPLVEIRPASQMVLDNVLSKLEL
jgi:4-hydroxy-tetrahydrodipicolinate synthase